MAFLILGGAWAYGKPNVSKMHNLKDVRTYPRDVRLYMYVRKAAIMYVLGVSMRILCTYVWDISTRRRAEHTQLLGTGALCLRIKNEV